MIITKITTINIHHGDDCHEVWIKHPDLKEMVHSKRLDALPELLEALFAAPASPGLQEAIDRVIIMHRLSKS